MHSLILGTREKFGDWATIKEFILIQGRFLEKRRYDRVFKSLIEITRAT